jgi:hypothetical protein
MFGDAASPRDWVEVGAVSADGGGIDENDHARCWTYVDCSAEVGGDCGVWDVNRHQGGLGGTSSALDALLSRGGGL